MNTDENNDGDTHTEHCCLEHGCKYGDEDCAVAGGTKKQDFPCFTCHESFQELQEIADEHIRPFLTWLQAQGLEICEARAIVANPGYAAEKGVQGLYPVRSGLFSRDVLAEYVESKRPNFPKE